MHAPPTGTVTFLFTDIEGSTKLWEGSPEAMRPALERHDYLLRQAIAAHNGYVFKTVGDAFCAAFATAPEALAGALAAQLALAAEPWGTETRLLVRMALHTGAADERDGDYFGQPLNRVARLIAAGHGGQTLLSDAMQGLVRDVLPPHASLRDMGQHRLKDLRRPEQVFQLLHPSLPADFPPLNSLNNPDLLNNLPQQLTSFIGREAQVAEVKVMLGKTRLLTLTGAGGSGKTRLSLQVAADLLDGEGDGVWLIELAALADPALVPQTVAGVLGVKEQAGQPIQRTLVEWLKPKRLLLILDNCEHLVAACASLATDFLRNCPGAHILASSREPLNVAGEQTYRVPSLSLPDPKQAQTVESLSQYEAVRLFIERAQAVQLSFAVTSGNAPAVAQVCFHLDGIPLAIELAAARVRSLSVEEINRRLDQRFRLLAGGSRNVLPRQQTLQALIDWSYDLLTEPEKSLLRRLSVFAGGWTLAAAEAVCSGDGIEEWEVVDLMTSLVDKSLVVYEEADGGGTGRSRLLETVRQYAGDRLEESGEAEAVRDRLASWFLKFAEEAGPLLKGPEQGLWLSRLEAEHDNLRTALAWGKSTPTGAERALQLAGALGRFWLVRGHLAEGRGHLTATLAGASVEVRTSVRACALDESGSLARGQGDLGTARSFYEAAVVIWREIGDGHGLANTLNGLGLVASDQGDYAAARAHYDEALNYCRENGDTNGATMILINLGVVASRLGDYAAARAQYEECLSLLRELGNLRALAQTRGNLGILLYRQGDFAEAWTQHEECLSLFREIGDKSGIAYTLTNLGLVAARLGDYAVARSQHEGSLACQREMGDRGGIAYGLEGLATVCRGEGDTRRSAVLWSAAGALRESIVAPLPQAEQAEVTVEVAKARAALGDAAFAAAWDVGRAMTMEQAVEYALAEGKE